MYRSLDLLDLQIKVLDHIGNIKDFGFGFEDALGSSCCTYNGEQMKD